MSSPSLVGEVIGHPRYIKTYAKLRDGSLKDKVDRVLDELKIGKSDGDYIRIQPYPTRYRNDDAELSKIIHLYK